MRYLGWLELHESSAGLLFLDDSLFDVFKLKERCIFDLIYLYGVVLYFTQFKKCILPSSIVTLTISLLIRER